MSWNILGAALAVGASLVSATAFAQQGPAPGSEIHTPDKALTAHDLDGLRAELRSSRKQIMAQTLKLSDAEATRFWPVYDNYQADLSKIKDGQYELIAEFANTFGKFTDAQAQNFISRWVALDVRTASLRTAYVPKVGKVLPGVKAASFFQIERRVSTMIDLKIMSQMPLMQVQSQLNN